jgi:hypothetical protein
MPVLDLQRSVVVSVYPLVRLQISIGVLICAWERNVDFKMFSYEEALATDPIVAQGILFAQNAALGAHTYILLLGRNSQRVPALMQTKEAKFLRRCTHKAARR